MSNQPDEKRAYQRGYAAGRKRTEAELAHWLRIHEELHDRRVQRKDAFFCAALNGLLPVSGWEMGGKQLASLDDYVELAVRFADAAMTRMPA
jgi:hypothetical protein